MDVKEPGKTAFVTHIGLYLYMRMPFWNEKRAGDI